MESELALSLWVTEAARSTVLGVRGHTAAAARVSGRARILATRCSELGVGLEHAFVAEHTRWMGAVAGTVEETGSLGWFFLQRIGSYVDVHSESILPKGYWARLVELGAPDAKDVEEALNRDGIPMSPPPEWPDVAPAEAPGTVHTRIGIIGDPHVGSRNGDKFVPPVLAELNRMGVDCSIAIGDLTQNGKLELFQSAKNLLETLEAPYQVILGNHDMWGGGTAEAVGIDRFNRVFNRPTYGVHQSGPVRIILLNSADPAPSPFPPFDIITGGFTNDPKESIPGGSFSPDMIEWASALGYQEGPTFIVLHHPPYPYLGFPALVFGLDQPSTETLTDLVIRTKAWGVIAGHTHRSALSELAGVPVLEVPAPKEWPYGFGLLEVSDTGWAFNLLPIKQPELVEQASFSANVVVRRYSRGTDEARAFSTTVPAAALAAAPPSGPGPQASEGH